MSTGASRVGTGDGSDSYFVDYVGDDDGDEDDEEEDNDSKADDYDKDSEDDNENVPIEWTLPRGSPAAFIRTAFIGEYMSATLMGSRTAML